MQQGILEMYSVCDKSKNSVCYSFSKGNGSGKKNNHEIDDLTNSRFREMDIAVICGWTTSAPLAAFC